MTNTIHNTISPPVPQRSHPRHTHLSTKYHKIIPPAIRLPIGARSHYTYHLRSSTLQPFTHPIRCAASPYTKNIPVSKLYTLHPDTRFFDRVPPYTFSYTTTCILHTHQHLFTTNTSHTEKSTPSHLLVRYYHRLDASHPAPSHRNHQGT